ncbi:MAG: DNA-binding NarL/FixJ family response regulator [Polaribacter sp.]|jgi:DNA-binding NarL/FixJ family response regulator|tara:strand:- start:1022 stop:1687 length:666 start_codon:yes stop_codon:yes gene_type:complete
MRKKIYVHVADDHKILIEGIIAIINTDEDIEIRDFSLNGQEVVDWFKKKENKADVLILDITMTLLDGFEVLKYFHSKKIDQKVIVLSSYDDVKIVQEVLKLGASGYISKSNAGEHILKAIKAVANGEQYFSNDIQKELLKVVSGQTTKKGDMPEDFLLGSLTEQEKKVLAHVTNELSTAEIAEKMNISPHTVESYRKKLLKKLNVKNSVGLAMYAIKNRLV